MLDGRVQVKRPRRTGLGQAPASRVRHDGSERRAFKERRTRLTASHSLPLALAGMFGFGAKREQAGDSAGAAAVPPAAVPAPRTLESVVEEELPIQRHAVAMEGGMPSCLTLFDNFLLCYCPSSLFPPACRRCPAHSRCPQPSHRRSSRSTATGHRATACPSLKTSSSACRSRGSAKSARRRSGSAGGQSGGLAGVSARAARTCGTPGSACRSPPRCLHAERTC